MHSSYSNLYTFTLHFYEPNSEVCSNPEVWIVKKTTGSKDNMITFTGNLSALLMNKIKKFGEFTEFFS